VVLISPPPRWVERWEKVLHRWASARAKQSI
jgi:hypothetical protein